METFLCIVQIERATRSEITTADLSGVSKLAKKIKKIKISLKKGEKSFHFQSVTLEVFVVSHTETLQYSPS